MGILLALPSQAAGPRKADFLQDYITCGLWMKQGHAEAALHAAIGRWAVDACGNTRPHAFLT